MLYACLQISLKETSRLCQQFLDVILGVDPFNKFATLEMLFWDGCFNMNSGGYLPNQRLC